jgi:VIT1/CCC1 family predicted Fe2+/Mn2+ transporter
LSRRPARRFSRWPSRHGHHAPEHVLDERARLERTSSIREIVFGAQDGLLTTLGVVQGVEGAHLNRPTLLVAAAAAAVSGMVAMGIGEYLASRAETDLARTEVEAERRSLRERPELETQEMVALLQRDGATEAQARDLAARLVPGSQLWFNTHVQKELGLTPDVNDRPLRNALVMGGSFIGAAIFPIAPHLFLSGLGAVIASVMITLIGLAAIGLIKSRVVGSAPFRSVAEVVGLGLAAAVVAYAAGSVLPRVFGLPPVLAS